jgi:MFS family permease
VDELALDAAQLGLMTSLFYASFAGIQLPLGSALDRLGGRLVTPLLMLSAVAGSLLFAVGESFLVLAAGRLLMGAGMAGVFMGSLKIFSRWFSSARFASASGYLVAFGALGALAAGTPLAWLNQAIGWRAVFAVGAAAILLSAASLFAWTRDCPEGQTLSLARDGDGGLGRIMRTLTFWRVALLDFFMVGSLLSLQGLWGGPFLVDVLGASKLEAGSVLTLLSLGALVGYIACGSLADRVGRRPVIFGGASVFVLSQSALVVLAFFPAKALALPAFLLFGFSGAFNILLKAHARATFPLELTGRAVTAVNFFGIGGAFVVQWVQGLIIGSFAPDRSGHYVPEAYAAAFGLAAIGGLGAVLFYFTGLAAKRLPVREQPSS